MDRTAVPFATITEMAATLRAGSLSAVALAEATLERIAALDKRLHAFIGLTRERALAEARAAEALLRAGHDVGPLQGIPYAVKDLYDVAGQPTTAGTPSQTQGATGGGQAPPQQTAPAQQAPATSAGPTSGGTTGGGDSTPGGTGGSGGSTSGEPGLVGGLLG